MFFETFFKNKNISKREAVLRVCWFYPRGLIHPPHTMKMKLNPKADPLPGESWEQFTTRTVIPPS
jgi:hypothetical protein